jgi:hypothetical protein
MAPYSWAVLLPLDAAATCRRSDRWRVYEALGRPRRLTPLDFMHLLYARFDPRPVRLDEGAVVCSVRSTNPV